MSSHPSLRISSQDLGRREDGALVGLVTLDDLLELFTEAMGNVNQLIKGELKKESRRRKA
jgi:hypothetical protein